MNNYQLADQYEYDYLNARKRLDAFLVIAELNPEDAKLIKKETDNEEYVKTLEKKAQFERIKVLNNEIEEILKISKNVYPDKSINEIMDFILDKDENLFNIISNKSRLLNDLVKNSTEEIWSKWKIGSYCVIGDGKMHGPFESFEDSKKIYNSIILWQSGFTFQIGIGTV